MSGTHSEAYTVRDWQPCTCGRFFPESSTLTHCCLHVCRRRNVFLESPQFNLHTTHSPLCTHSYRLVLTAISSPQVISSRFSSIHLMWLIAPAAYQSALSCGWLADDLRARKAFGMSVFECSGPTHRSPRHRLRRSRDSSPSNRPPLRATRR